jgi:hypothetical protein
MPIQILDSKALSSLALFYLVRIRIIELV